MVLDKCTNIIKAIANQFVDSDRLFHLSPQRTKNEAPIIFSPPNSSDSANDPINQSAKPMSGRILIIGFNRTTATATEPNPKINKSNFTI